MHARIESIYRIGDETFDSESKLRRSIEDKLGAHIDNMGINMTPKVKLDIMEYLLENYYDVGTLLLSTRDTEHDETKYILDTGGKKSSRLKYRKQ